MTTVFYRYAERAMLQIPTWRTVISARGKIAHLTKKTTTEIKQAGAYFMKEYLRRNIFHTY